MMRPDRRSGQRSLTGFAQCPALAWSFQPTHSLHGQLDEYDCHFPAPSRGAPWTRLI